MVLSTLLGFKSKYNFQDKVAIVTGSSSGIGKALAIELALAGAKVVLSGRRGKVLRDILNELPQSKFRHYAIAADVSKEEDCKRLIEETVEHYGRVDVLINNAGISQVHRFEEYENLEGYRSMMNTNYFGTLYCTYYALPHVKKSVDGMIVAVSSICGKLGVPTFTGYAASKHALHGFLDSLRTEHIDDPNLHIMLACPGYVDTGIHKRAISNVSKEEGSHDVKIDRGDSIMTAEECAERIIAAMKRRRREVMVVSSIKAKVAPIARYFSPHYIDREVVRMQKGGRT